MRLKSSWLEATSPRYEAQGLAGMILRSDMLVSDIDDTIAKSPMKKIAFGFLKRPKMLVNPGFISWCIKAGWHLLKGGKKAESALEKEFVESFLGEEEMERVKSIITPEYAAGSFFPGVKEFYSLLPNIKKAFVTRSIEEVADAYRIAAGFDAAFYFQHNKEESMRRIAMQFPARRRYVFIGDSSEDEDALDYLKFLHRYVKIETLVSVYVAKSQECMNRNFDINIGRDYTGLAELVKSIPSSSAQ